jgi:hypothetical protein
LLFDIIHGLRLIHSKSVYTISFIIISSTNQTFGSFISLNELFQALDEPIFVISSTQFIKKIETVVLLILNFSLVSPISYEMDHSSKRGGSL